MSEIDSGGPAFPYCVWVGDHHNGHNTGMSLRDYFAGMALQGYRSWCGTNVYSPESIAEWAYKDADAMIKAGKGEK